MQNQSSRFPNEILLRIMKFHSLSDFDSKPIIPSFRNFQLERLDEDGNRSSHYVYRQLCQMTRKVIMPKIWFAIFVMDKDDMAKILKWAFLTPNVGFYLQHLWALSWLPVDDLFAESDPNIFSDKIPGLDWKKVAEEALLKFFENCKSVQYLFWRLSDFNPLPLPISKILQSHKSLQDFNLSYTIMSSTYAYSSIPLGWTKLSFIISAPGSRPINGEEPEDIEWMIEELEQSHADAFVDPKELFGLTILKAEYMFFDSSYMFYGVMQIENLGYERFPSWLMANILENLKHLLEDAKPIQHQDGQMTKPIWKPLANIIPQNAELMYLTSYLPIFLFAVEISLSGKDDGNGIKECVDAIQSVRRLFLKVLASANLKEEKEVDEAIIGMCETTLREMHWDKSESKIKHTYLKGAYSGLWPDFDKELDTNEHTRQILLALKKDDFLRASIVKVFKTLKEYCLVYEGDLK